MYLLWNYSSKAIGTWSQMMATIKWESNKAEPNQLGKKIISKYFRKMKTRINIVFNNLLVKVFKISYFA